MRLFITLSKKSLCIILAALIIILILAGKFFSVKAAGIDGSTNEKRCNFIVGLGYQIDETPVNVKEITMPERFNDVYENYNSIQKNVGFNLADFKGESAVIYTYKSTDREDTVINIIVSGKYIIGGDISSVRIDGEMEPLERKKDVKNTA